MSGAGGVAHRFALRVYYEDTDFGGVVYHANYLKFMERARTEWLRALGVEQARLKRDTGLAFVVRRLSVEYLGPAMMDDQLFVETRLRRLGAASLELEQAIDLGAREGPTPPKARLATASLTVACVSAAGRPARLPEAVAARVAEA